MRYGVVRADGRHPFGVNRDGTLQAKRDSVELMTLAEAEQTAETYGGSVVSERRLFPTVFRDSKLTAKSS